MFCPVCQRLQPQHGRAVGQPRAEGGQGDGLAVPEPAVLAHLVDEQRDAGGRGVAAGRDVAGEFLLRQVQAFKMRWLA